MPMAHVNAFRSEGKLANADYATMVATLTPLVGRDIIYGEAANPIQGAVGLELWEPTEAKKQRIYEVCGNSITWWSLAGSEERKGPFRSLVHVEQPGGGILLDLSQGEDGPLLRDRFSAATKSSPAMVRVYLFTLLHLIPQAP